MTDRPEGSLSDDFNGWRIREVSGSLAMGVRFIVAAPGCPILNHPLKDCECAAFEHESEAVEYTATQTVEPQPLRGRAAKRRRAKTAKRGPHARNYICDDCGRWLSKAGMSKHQRARGHIGFTTVEEYTRSDPTSPAEATASRGR